MSFISNFAQTQPLYAKGGLAAASKSLEEGKITKIISNYFQNRGIPLRVGLAELQKQIKEGLKLIQFENSVMGVKPLDGSVAQIHFFTTATAQDLVDDMQYFVAELKNMGIKTVYDTEPSPITTAGLKRLGARIVQSDNPKYPFKAML